MGSAAWEANTQIDCAQNHGHISIETTQHSSLLFTTATKHKGYYRTLHSPDGLTESDERSSSNEGVVVLSDPGQASPGYHLSKRQNAQAGRSISDIYRTLIIFNNAYVSGNVNIYK